MKHRCSAVLCAGNLINMMVDEMHMKVNGSCVEERIHFYSAVSQHQNTMQMNTSHAVIYMLSTSITH